MLDIKFIKENKELVKKAVEHKKLGGLVDVDKILNQHAAYLDLLKKVEAHRALRNQLSEAISKVTPEERTKLISEAAKVKEELKQSEAELAKSEDTVKMLLLDVPNVIDPEVPIGKDSSENISLRKVGKPRVFDFTPKDHVELGKLLDLIDIEKAGEVSGSRFYYLKNEAVLLEYAIVNFVFDTLRDPKILKTIAKKAKNPSDKAFVPVAPPLFVKASVMDRMARLKPIEERYYFEKDDLVLVGSAEHTLGPMHMDENLRLDQLPIRYIGFSPAFRREAGSYGLDTKGIIRVHQFDKLEMECFTTIETGRVEQDFIVGLQEYLVEQLGIPYQVVAICTGDMGNPDYRQLDIECWIPSQGKYRETHTSDYMTDYQSRRLSTTYTTEAGGREFVHMNDATAIAIGRMLVAILENYQEKDGSVIVPKALRKYVGFEVIKKK
jgi:seryl-tRNA synthetase